MKIIYSISTHLTNKTRYFVITVVFTISLIASGCNKFIEVDSPPTSVNVNNVYASDATAIGVLTGMYINMSIDDNNSLVNTASGYVCMNLYPALSADELILYSAVDNPSLIAYYKNSLKNNNTGSSDFWNKFYPAIYKINAAIEGLSDAKSLTTSIKNQLLGEAYFLRAFSFFQLVNLYGDIPLTLNTDYTVTSILPRASKNDVYKQIVLDLLQAQSLMADKYYDASLLKQTSERVRPNKSAATALLARAYLYANDWVNAELQASKVIENIQSYDTVPLNDIFLKNSKETIWALQPVDVGTNSNTGEGRLFILPSTGPSANFPEYHPVYLNPNLVQSFEPTDQRLNSWVNSVTISGVKYSYPFKYKIGYENTSAKEYPIVLRLAEQYLIRAEARAKQGKVTGSNSAKSDLDIIRIRAGLLGTTASDEPAMISAIMAERRHELFTEWGHRWLDLKRTGLINNIMPTIAMEKGGTWDDRWALYPIPLAVTQTSLNVKQNPGYE